jgi:plastocyanin
MRTRLAAVVVVFALGACGGDAAGTTTTEASPTPTSEPVTTTSVVQAEPGTATITIQNFSFVGSPTVAVGEAVEVVNEDGPNHTWTAEDGTFDSGTLSSGDTFSFTFDEAGEYAFFCAIHPGMTGSLTVEG